MRNFKLFGIVAFASLMSMTFSACGNKKTNVSDGQKALDAAVKKQGNAADIEYQYLERREYYKNQGDAKNADYYDRKAKEQSKEVQRLRQEAEKNRKETYGDVWK